MDDSHNLDSQDCDSQIPELHNSDTQSKGPSGEEATSSITPEQQTQIDRAKRRNLIFAVIFGIILLILGFFAGRSARENREDSLPFSPLCSACDVLENWE